MKYVSIDIETLGLNIDAPIIEVACVFVDNGEIVGSAETYVYHDKYDNCEPFAMSMHPETLRLISNPEVCECTGSITHISNIGMLISEWLAFYGFEGKTTFAGKNAAGFDIPMLEHQCPGFKALTQANHRVLDPGPMFAKRGDNATPNLPSILADNNLEGLVTHTALDDALAVVAAVEYFFDRQEASA